MGLFDDKVDSGELALLETAKIKRVVEDLYASVEKIKSVLPELEKQLARIGGMLEANHVNVTVQSDNIKNIGVAEGNGKVEQVNG